MVYTLCVRGNTTKMQEKVFIYGCAIRSSFTTDCFRTLTTCSVPVTGETTTCKLPAGQYNERKRREKENGEKNAKKKLEKKKPATVLSQLLLSANQERQLLFLYIFDTGL